MPFFSFYSSFFRYFFCFSQVSVLLVISYITITNTQRTAAMSLQEHGLRAGLSMFNGQGAHKTNSDGEEKSNDQSSTTKESNNSSPIKDNHATSSFSSPSNVKPVGSNRFVVLIYLIQIFYYLQLDCLCRPKNN